MLLLKDVKRCQATLPGDNFSDLFDCYYDEIYLGIECWVDNYCSKGVKGAVSHFSAKITALKLCLWWLLAGSQPLARTLGVRYV